MVNLVSTLVSPGPSLQSCFPAVCPSHVLVPGAVSHQIPYFTLPADLGAVSISPFLQPAEVAAWPFGESATTVSFKYLQGYVEGGTW